MRLFSNVWSENTARFERLMEIHSNSPKLYYGFKPVVEFFFKWIIARSCGKQKWHSFAFSLRWKGKIWGLDIVTKCALENKLLNQNCWSWYHFSQEKLPHTLIYVYCIYILWEVCRSYFLWATLYISRAIWRSEPYF